ncbi:MAG: aldose 1-epimerase [Acidimicrobiales bacterium]|nr:MAG: aldose 1-epimerase [Acidimicrobiales bacterium]
MTTGHAGVESRTLQRMDGDDDRTLSAGGRPKVEVRTWRKRAALVLSAEGLEATFLPEVGMAGVSLRWRGREFLALGGSLEDASRTPVGMALLHPWANRLSQRHYSVDGREVSLADATVPCDENGLPIHGTLLGRDGWRVTWVNSGVASATVRARLSYGEHLGDAFAAFPFPHDVLVEITVDGSLTVSTTIEPTGPARVPVSFGWHPYFRVPGARRASLRLYLPTRRVVELDPRGIPTGRSEVVGPSREPLGARHLDDHFVIGNDRRVELRGGRHRVVVTLGEGFPYAQIYAPAGSTVVAIEPMTSLVDALTSGGCPLVAPGSTYTAHFTVSVDEI